MTNLVDRLRESADQWLNEIDTRREAADEIERLRAEVEEQCRLNGMGAERELRLTCSSSAKPRWAKFLKGTRAATS